MATKFRFLTAVRPHVLALLRLTEFANDSNDRNWCSGSSDAPGVYGFAQNALKKILAVELNRLGLPAVSGDVMDDVAEQFPVRTVRDLEDVVDDVLARREEDAEAEEGAQGSVTLSFVFSDVARRAVDRCFENPDPAGDRLSRLVLIVEKELRRQNLPDHIAMLLYEWDSVGHRANDLEVLVRKAVNEEEAGVRSFDLNLAGNQYTVEADLGTGKILRVACLRRWPLSDVKFVGDDWLVGELQKMVETAFEDEATREPEPPTTSR